MKSILANITTAVPVGLPTNQWEWVAGNYQYCCVLQDTTA